MNLTNWISENRLVASLCGAFLVIASGLCYLTIGAWEDYGTAIAEYSQKAEALKSLSNQKPPPTDATRQALESELKAYQSDLDAVFARLGKFRVPTFGHIAKAKPSDQPQEFQDVLRKEVTLVKSIATQSRSKLPAPFYLGLDAYENKPPSAEEVLALSRQLTVFDWVAENLLSHKEVIIEEFTRPQPQDARKKEKEPAPGKLPQKGNGPDIKSPLPYQTTAELQLKFRCSQTAFREFVNTIATAPYFLVIENVQVQNSSLEPPPREPSPSASREATPTNAPSSAEKLPVIVGREQLAISMKLRSLDFTDPRVATPNPIPAR